MTRNRRGFTLLEMLIAITVLVILAGVTVFSTLDLVTVADANKVINDMMQLKTATLMWYKENSSRIVPSTFKIKTNGTEQYFSEFIKNHGSEIMKYLRTSVQLRYKKSTNDIGDYSLIAVNSSKQWYVCCNLGETKDTSDMEAPYMKIKSKLAGNAKTLGLRGTASLENDTIPSTYTDQKFVCMHILTLEK